jgi:1-acyl-sn-glycerol-3-phosphate acyltransferase
MIPIDRGGGSAAARALDAAARVLDRGELFGIYPEGTRARDGKLHKGHTGPARLAVRTGAPIVPVGIIGTRDIQPPEARFPKPFKRAEIRFGRPIRVEKYQGRDDVHLAYRQIIDEVMYEIRELSGQEYVDTYATKKAEALPTEVAQVPSLNGHGEGPEALDLTNGTGRKSSADVLTQR